MISSKVIGIWDFCYNDIRLGSLFIFVKEMELFSQAKDIIIVKNYEARFSSFIELMRRFSSHDIRILPANDQQQFSPTIHDTLPHTQTSRSGSLRWISSLYKQKGFPDPLVSNKSIIIRDADCDTTISVHLKNNTHDRKSNASQTDWYNAFSKIYELYPNIKFILVGDDKLVKPFHTLANIHCFRGSVADYFSVVVEADAFVGMSSAFCGAAILGRKPYRIWKHKGHHSDEMARELDSEGQFTIRTNNQKFLLDFDCQKAIVTELTKMVNTTHV